MYIQSETDSHLVLVGIPGRRIWMIVLCGCGALITTGAVALIWMTYQASGGWRWSFLPLSIGVLIGQGLFWIGAITLGVGRLTLVLDSSTWTGDYQVRSPVIEVGKPCSFKLEHVDSVIVEATNEWRPGHDDRPETTATVQRAILRIKSPRRSITLDETENNRNERVESLAKSVAAFLGKQVQYMVGS